MVVNNPLSCSSITSGQNLIIEVSDVTYKEEFKKTYSFNTGGRNINPLWATVSLAYWDLEGLTAILLRTSANGMSVLGLCCIIMSFSCFTSSSHSSRAQAAKTVSLVRFDMRAWMEEILLVKMVIASGDAVWAWTRVLYTTSILIVSSWCMVEQFFLWV